ncbi:hypothetical protein F4778DRAFT_777372 [Xylariomycetidae sp. FL2044]|nr:hypothetical protein F4778DRAFT_777372 [Xylariomycetidae sp. FL2044]
MASRSITSIDTFTYTATGTLDDGSLTTVTKVQQESWFFEETTVTRTDGSVVTATIDGYVYVEVSPSLQDVLIEKATSAEASSSSLSSSVVSGSSAIPTSASQTAIAADSSSSPGLASSAVAAIVVGCLLGLTLLAGLSFLVFYYRRKALSRRRDDDFNDNHAGAPKPDSMADTSQLVAQPYMGQAPVSAYDQQQAPTSHWELHSMSPVEMQSTPTHSELPVPPGTGPSFEILGREKSHDSIRYQFGTSTNKEYLGS